MFSIMFCAFAPCRRPVRSAGVGAGGGRSSCRPLREGGARSFPPCTLLMVGVAVYSGDVWEYLRGGQESLYGRVVWVG